MSHRYFSGYITLMSVFIVGAIGLAVAATLLTLGLSATQTSQALEYSYQAKALADACAERALQGLHDNASYAGESTVTLGNGTCDITVSGTGATRTIDSVGTVGGVKRKVKVQLSQVTPQPVVSSWQEVADF